MLNYSFNILRDEISSLESAELILKGSNGLKSFTGCLVFLVLVLVAIAMIYMLCLLWNKVELSACCSVITLYLFPVNLEVESWR